MKPTLYAHSPSVQRSLRLYAANGVVFAMVEMPKGNYHLSGMSRITIETDYELGQYPVTQALWEAVMGENPAFFKGKHHPVENISWGDICDPGGFLEQLNALPEIAARNAADGRCFDLPMEVQWEYAAQGGTYHRRFYYPFAGSKHLPEIGWYLWNSQKMTQSVGRKLPNVLGLYDMSGNVREWCHSSFVTRQEDVGEKQRGGSWDEQEHVINNVSDAEYSNFDKSSKVGLRLARVPARE